MLQKMQRENFLEAMQYPMTFQTALVELAALHDSNSIGHRDTRQVLRQKQRTIQMLSESLRNVHSLASDNAIMAASGAAIVEVSQLGLLLFLRNTN